MSEFRFVDAELRSLEANLASLAPRTPSIDRDHLMFEAGRHAAPRRAWAWPTATLLTGIVAIVVGRNLAPTAPPEMRHVPAIAATPGNEESVVEHLPEINSIARLRRGMLAGDLAASNITASDDLPQANRIAPANSWLEERRRLLAN
jgi:hypothetical protein